MGKPKPIEDVKKKRLQAKISNELGPTICNALEDNSVIEIMLNPDGVLWIEKIGKGIQAEGEVDALKALSAIKTISSYVGTTVTAKNPLIGCELPLDSSRFQGVIPPIVPRPTFTIRKKAIKIFSLDDYQTQGALETEHADIICKAIKDHKNIVIVGSTGSGKTTLANAVILGIVDDNPDQRIVIIEDTNEIQCAAKNSVILRSNDDTSMLDLLRATLRLRPDRILVGEVRGKEAWTLVKAWNTGHPGGVVTVHANGALAGLSRLEQLSAEDGDAPKNVSFLRKQIGDTVDVVVFIEKTADGRKITEIVTVNGFDDDDGYQVTPIHTKPT